ncbi:MAG: GNAT family N-acetyltransferase [Clostridiales bacterium]|jgi:RimJ/RimL family protein N-acetyltransferase|nr:GNAT family N-acetyltransferase [Clostridiales bacterium]
MTNREITNKYYAKWIGTELDLLEEPGIYWIYNAERNDKPIGYPKVYDVYVFITPQTIIISYGDKAIDKISTIKNKVTLGTTVAELNRIMNEAFSLKPEHKIKYIYSCIKTDDKQFAKRLLISDYKLYLDFFKTTNPNCKDTSWVEDYFVEIVEKGYCHGVIINNLLVSVTDAPDMPFMSNKTQEIGINTLTSFRGKGYGKSACLSCIGEMIRTDICPQWSTVIDNIASQNLAVSIGFEKYFDNLLMSL